MTRSPVSETKLTNGAAVTLYAIDRQYGLADGPTCMVNDALTCDAVVAAWIARGYVVTYDVEDVGSEANFEAVRAGRMSRHEAVPVAGAWPSFHAYRQSLKR